MNQYVVFWKDAPGQQINTVVDAHGDVVTRESEYVKTNNITVLEHDDEIVDVINHPDGTKYAVTPDLAREVLGWEV